MKTHAYVSHRLSSGLVGMVACLTCTLLPSQSLRAQSVIGAVLDANTSAPLLGVLISLLDPDGERVRAVLSDEDGRFAMDVGRFGRFSIRAERIGLQATTSATFDLFSMEPRFERILMGDRAVRITGLVVDTRVKQCRNDAASAVLIQRWWQEVRTALDVSTVVQAQALAQFQVERFERQWGPRLERILSVDRSMEVMLSNQPFVSAEADFLAEGGFVQGDMMGQREYYAPDAAVLLSDVFLNQHCFSIVSNEDDERLIGLAFEPTRSNDVPEIRGTLWIDSTSAELQNLDFRYVNLEGLPQNESGGLVAFDYLASGAWVVHEWYIRMPKLGTRGFRSRQRLVLLGYIDVGAVVRQVNVAAVDRDRSGAVGSIYGSVFDSIRGRGLAGATVSILGTRFQATTDEGGAFALTDVPVGEHDITFFHPDPQAWGLGSSFVHVEVEEGVSTRADLALPAFRQAARLVCMGSGGDAESVLIGEVVNADGEGYGNVELEIVWNVDVGRSGVREREIEGRTGSDGHFVVCTIPGETTVRVRANIEGTWTRGFVATLRAREITYRQLIISIQR